MTGDDMARLAEKHAAAKAVHEAAAALTAAIDSARRKGFTVRIWTQNAYSESAQVSVDAAINVEAPTDDL